MKSMLRLWNPPVFWRITRVYIPNALPDILTGLRASATWAIGATLISEGLLNGIPGDTSTLGSFLVMPFNAPPGRTPTAIILSTALGFLVYFIFCFLESKIQLYLLGSAKQTERDYS
jgi:ABC-type nitrate/sulfonate/bicarbonate transport system permease component